jgi:hypothetical protein
MRELADRITCETEQPDLAHHGDFALRRHDAKAVGSQPT